jgi:hypothetical protein
MTAPFTDLTVLATHLRSLAGAHQPIVLDDSILAATSATAIAVAFALPAGQNLRVTGIAPGDIGDPTDDVLTIGTGTGSVLRLAGVPIAVSFWIAGGTLQLSVTATMPGRWTFTDSFTDLTLFPFDSLTVTDARFVYSSVEQPTFSWPGEEHATIDLQPGQNLLCRLGLGGVSLVANLLGAVIGKDNSFRCYGPFAPTAGQQLPVGTLTASIDTSGFSIGTAPNALSLAAPRVAVRIGTADDDTNPVQEIDLLVLGTFQQVLQVSVAIPMAGGLYQVSTTPLPGDGSVTSLIKSLPGGADFTDYIPAELNSIFASVGLDNFTMAVNTTPEVSYLGLSISTLQPWPLITDVLVLKGLNLVVEVLDPSGLNWTSVWIAARAEFLPHIFTGEFDFAIGLEKQTSWEVSAVSGSYHRSVNLGDLVEGLLNSQESVPAVLRAISFADFGVSAARPAPGQPFDYTCYGNAQVALPLLGTELTAQLTVVFSKTTAGYSVHLAGALAIGGEAFTLTLDLGSADSKLQATWESTGHPLGFEDIAAAFGFTDPPAIPDGLDLQLAGASFSYDFTKSELMLTAESAGGGGAVFIADTGTASSALYLFGIHVPLSIHLSDIPVVGGKIPDGANIGVLDAGVWVLSRPVTSDEVTQLNNRIKAAPLPHGVSAALPLLPAPEPPATSLTNRLLLSATLQLGPAGNVPLQLSLLSMTGAAAAIGPADARAVPGAARGTAAAIAPAGASADVAATGGAGAVTPPPTSPDGAKWIEVNKALGPLSVQRIGLKYADSEVYFLVDIGLSADGLTVDLAGLAVSSPLKTFAPSFHLSGIDLEFKSSVFEIAGEFLNVPKDQLPAGADFEYAGAATLAVADFDLTALGSYARISGQTSVFVFAVLDYPLGGPAFFFVTGAAAGFGYNRRLILPSVEEVPNFPLVAATIDPSSVFPGGSNKKDSLSQALGVLDKYIPPSLGDYFLAAGIRFTTFEMLSSVALLSVAFGNRLEIALLGDSRLSIPADPTGEHPDNPKIASVELALEVRIDPDEGDFKASAVLTTNSWVLSPDCRLTGGFAFYIWYGGEHEGDFVITLGGYNPHYQPAQWYPNEPRLGINWALSDVLTIKGGSYFALTPHAIMAGGSLEVVFQAGGLRAWLTANADFLVEWQPFHYEIDIGISVGVSFTFSLFGAQITLSLEIGASLELWGPPFGGTATIHLWIISFTIPFGDQTPTAPALSFNEFNVALLPKGQGAGQQDALDAQGPRPALAAGADPRASGDAQASTPIFIVPSITAGIIESPASNSKLSMPLVAAGALEIQVTTHWPSTQLNAGPTDGGGKAAPAPDQPIFSYQEAVYANPMHGTEPFTGTLTVEIIYDTKTSFNEHFVFEPILKNAPAALWTKWDSAGPAINPPTDSDGNPIVTVPDVPFGIRIRARAEDDRDPGVPIPLENFATEPESICVSWPTYSLPAEISGDGLDEIEHTITDHGVGDTRMRIMQQLTSAGIRNLPGTVAFSPGLARQPDDLFLDVPAVASLGQVPSPGRV